MSYTWGLNILANAHNIIFFKKDRCFLIIIKKETEESSILQSESGIERLKGIFFIDERVIFLPETILSIFIVLWGDMGMSHCLVWKS